LKRLSYGNCAKYDGETINLSENINNKQSKSSIDKNIESFMKQTSKFKQMP